MTRWFCHIALFMFAATPVVARAEIPFVVTTNAWSLPAKESIERIAFFIGPDLSMAGRALNDTFWISQGPLNLAGQFRNDVWAIADSATLTGEFADHARLIARSINLQGTISNGLWAVAMSISSSTNSTLAGDHLIAADTMSLLGQIDGNLYARARQITLGGHITGDVYLAGDDIIIRPGTVVQGTLRYVTAGEPVALDANSRVEGGLTRIELPAASDVPARLGLYALLYWFTAALLTGIPFMLIFPRFTGTAVQSLRANLIKCGLTGLAGLVLIPVLTAFIFATIVGIPLALTLAATYGLILYLGKFPVALAIGTALLQRRGQISLSLALVTLVIGLFLFYALSLIPVLGSSLQAAATAFGTGSILVALASGRGQVRNEQQETGPPAQA